MSSNVKHTVLARSYRPTKFADVVGQDHVKNAIQNSILNEKLHSVYLLSGTRGIGKTTIARIFAKAMNCVNYAAHKEPCGECPSCVSFQEANNPSIIEIDAASRSSVADTREIIESINFPALVNNYTVYIIDEVHMLTTSSFNALLKTLEEPPPQVKFILCTTDPQKIPATVLSRCLHFHLRPITQDQIANHLMNLLSKENISYDERAMQLIARLANGSMRDALSLTEQAIALGENQVSLKIVQQMVGMVDDIYAINMCIAILNRDAQAAFDVLKQVKVVAPDWRQFVCQILEVAHIAALLPFLSETEKQQYVGTHDDLIAFVKQPPEQNQNLVEVTQVVFEIFTHALKQLEVIGNAEQVIHLSIIRAIAFTVSTEYIGNFELINEAPQPVKRDVGIKKLKPNRYDSGVDTLAVDRTAVNGNNVNNHIRHPEVVAGDEAQEESLSILDTIPGNTVPNKLLNSSVDEVKTNRNGIDNAVQTQSTLAQVEVSTESQSSLAEQISAIQTNVNQPGHNFTSQNDTTLVDKTLEIKSTTVAHLAGIELQKRDNQPVDSGAISEVENLITIDLTSDSNEVAINNTHNNVTNISNSATGLNNKAKLPQNFSLDTQQIKEIQNLNTASSSINFASFSTSAQDLFVTETKGANNSASIVVNATLDNVDGKAEQIVTPSSRVSVDTSKNSAIVVNETSQEQEPEQTYKTVNEEIAEIVKYLPAVKEVVDLKLSGNNTYQTNKTQFGYNLGEFKNESQTKLKARPNSDKDILVIPYDPGRRVLIPGACDLHPPTKIPYQNTKILLSYITPNNFRAVGKVYLEKQRTVSKNDFIQQLAYDLVAEAVENDKLFKFNKFYVNLPNCLEQISQILHKSQQIKDLLTIGLQETELRFLKNTYFNLNLATKEFSVVDASNLMAGIEPRDYVAEIEKIATSKGFNFKRVPIEQKNNFESYSLMSIAYELLEDYLEAQFVDLLHDENVLLRQARAFFGVKENT